MLTRLPLMIGGHPQQVKDFIVAFCGKKGGTYNDNLNVCIQPSNPDHPLFYARVDIDLRPPSGASSRATVRVVEPAPGAFTPEYQQALSAVGFVTSTEKAARGAKARAEFEALQAQHQARQKNMGKKGERVCRDDGDAHFKGFIDDKAEERIKIISLTKTERSRGPFPQSPDTIWDAAKNWYVSE